LTIFRELMSDLMFSVMKRDLSPLSLLIATMSHELEIYTKRRE
jgi:hypothetical protein